MKLYLAIAVLMLAFTALTEAQEEQTTGQGFSQIGDKLTEVAKNFATQTKEAFEKIQNSDIAETTRTWFEEQFKILKEKVAEMRQ